MMTRKTKIKNLFMFSTTEQETITRTYTYTRAGLRAFGLQDTRQDKVVTFDFRFGITNIIRR